MADTNKTPSEKPSRGPKWLRSMSPRARWIAGTVLTVLVLAAVILGVSLFNEGDSPQADSITQLSPEQQSKLEYEKAVDALESDETSKAVEMLEKAVELDPNNTQAQQALNEVTRPSTSNGDSGGSGESNGDSGGDDDGNEPEPKPEPKPEDPAFLKPVADLTVLLPKRVEDYSLGSATGTKADMVVSGDPTGESAASRTVWTVHDRKTAAAAKAFITDVSKSLYGKDKATPTVDGVTAYFGTDGTRFATIVYVRGRYVFEVVLTGSGGAPKQLREEAEKTAKAFPDKL